MPSQHYSYYSDNKRASVIFYKIGYVFLICHWLPPWKTSFWLSNERLKKERGEKKGKNINVAEQDKKKAPYSECVSHSLHILLFVWCRYWVSSEKSGLHSPRMAASVWLKWNRNVIRNQCIRTCPDVSTIAPHTFLSHSLPLFSSVSLPFSLSRSNFSRSPSPSKPQQCGGRRVE